MDTIEKTGKIMTTPLGKFKYFFLGELSKQDYDVEELPFSIRILLENAIRNFNNNSFNRTHLDNILNWNPKPAYKEIPYLPARVEKTVKMTT